MPKLYQVLEQELGSGTSFDSLPRSLLDGEVVGVFLASGAPCDSHSAGFADWPGSESDVSRWFRLAAGASVGIRSRDGAPHGLALWGHEENG